MNPGQTLIRTSELARLVVPPVHRDTVSRWGSGWLKPALARRGYFKVAVLIRLGVLTPPPVEQEIISHA